MTVGHTTRYGVVLADPPWGGDPKYGPQERTRRHYPLMTAAQISSLDVGSVCKNDCVLVLWSTWMHLEDAFTVITSWGFSYRSGMVWVKTLEPPSIDMFGQFRGRLSFGLGRWVRGCSEPILIATRGRPKHPKIPFLGIISERLEHSRKPDDIYDFCESMDGPYLEMFARRRRDGWDCYGNEVDGSISLPTR